MRSVSAIGLVCGLAFGSVLACTRVSEPRESIATGESALMEMPAVMATPAPTPVAPTPMAPTACCAPGQTKVAPLPVDLSDLPACKPFNPPGGGTVTNVMGEQLAKCLSEATCALGRAPTAAEFMDATNFGAVSLICTASDLSAQPAICKPGEPCYRRRCIDSVGGFQTGAWCSIRLGDRGADAKIECLDAVSPNCGANPRQIELASACTDNAQGRLGKVVVEADPPQKCGNCHHTVNAQNDEFGCMAMPQNFTCPLLATTRLEADGRETLVPVSRPVRGPESTNEVDACALLKDLWFEPNAPLEVKEDILGVAKNRGCPFALTRKLILNATGTSGYVSASPTHGCSTVPGVPTGTNSCVDSYPARNKVYVTATPTMATGTVTFTGPCETVLGNTCIVDMGQASTTPATVLAPKTITATFRGEDIVIATALPAPPPVAGAIPLTPTNAPATAPTIAPLPPTVNPAPPH